MKYISVFGSTGSIGKNTLDIVRKFNRNFRIHSLASFGSSLDLISMQIKEFKPKIVCIYSKPQADLLAKIFPKLEIVSGEEGLIDMAADASVDIAVYAMTGLASFKPFIKSIESGKRLAVATKELFVAGGEFIKKKIKKHKNLVIPVDSEHNSLFTLINDRDIKQLKHVTITASGGPFLNWTEERMKHIQLKDAIKHPNWNMGPKNTVDSSNLVNKGLEYIEAGFLFDLSPEQIKILVHPQSIIHSMAHFVDNTVVAQMSVPDMRSAIQHSLFYPVMKPGVIDELDFGKITSLTFQEPDYKRFPALKLAIDSFIAGGSAPCCFNAANEILVDKFLKQKISWFDIQNQINEVLENHLLKTITCFEDILEVYNSVEEFLN